MFFDDLQGLARVILVGVPAYAALIILLRISGKRTLSKMNAFDLVVTVALGSTLASILTTSSVAFVEGVLAFALLIALQFIVAWASSRWAPVNRLVKAEPSMLFYRGEYLSAAMRRERVTRDDVLSAIRSAGIVALADVEAVVMDATGDLAVLRRADLSGAEDQTTSLDPVRDHTP